MDLYAIISAYEQDYQKRARAEQRFYAMQRTLDNAIHYSALCMVPRTGRPGYKRHSHQRRIPLAALERAKALLLNARQRLTKAADFDALHAIVSEAIGPLRGIGPLTVYDIAHRLGSHLGKSPAEVYLHAGTRQGAKELGLTGERVSVRQLPAAFRRLTPAEIEDCLCIYKSEIAKTLRARNSSHLKGRGRRVRCG